MPLSCVIRFRRKAVPVSLSRTRFQSAVARFCLPLPAVSSELNLFSMVAVLLTRLIEPVGEPRPLSVPAGPFNTSICSMLKTSREMEPTSRTPST
ncbi:hypothetical protein D9M71_747150 [compost metagenome]